MESYISVETANVRIFLILCLVVVSYAIVQLIWGVKCLEYNPTTV